ncbi:MAG: hypothetical protein JO352_35950 [Chloroflexi bacterium]|nr:hypothetical protein [Chloroflexota bacterium]
MGGGQGSVVIVDQRSHVTNKGTATATTGNNTATGNNSVNTANNNQQAGNGNVTNNTSAASNRSDGTAGITTGNASATGNSSTTGINQTVNASAGGKLGGVLIVDQNANVLNSGSATATTGGNNAIGNNSLNDVRNRQDPHTNRVANNVGTVTNHSDGTAGVDTGNATSTGNSSSTGVNQIANGGTTGSLGGIVIVNQSAHVTNHGTATAKTGGNHAIGNNSDNLANNVQGAVSGRGPPGANSVANNSGAATNNSDGTARITTGDATAVGNSSDTNITQGASGSIDGKLGGLVLVTQHAPVTNTGSAVATTGNNRAIGNFSDNDVRNRQQAAAGSAIRNSVAANFGQARNNSDGTARVSTGDASATGNDASTTITQWANYDAKGAGSFSIVDQAAPVFNHGTAVARTGNNRAVGNDSFNTAVNNQRARTVGGRPRSAVAANFGQAGNISDGTAKITTGDAEANGNISDTTISQTSNFDPGKGNGSFSLVDQRAPVTNRGTATADSGHNTARGNLSDNDAINNQRARVAVGGGFGRTNRVANNSGTARNNSDGTATVDTGDATATGNDSSAGTTVDQSANFAGGNGSFFLPTQTARVDNRGTASSNSGRNNAVGNASFNTVLNSQRANNTSGGRGGNNSVASNNGGASNNSDGSAHITTGGCCANGNYSTTNISQQAGFDGGRGSFSLPVQTVRVDNRGTATGDSGHNTAKGNLSDNDAINRQRANVNAAGAIRGNSAVANNTGTASNRSDGSASIETGDVTACGNVATTNIGQTANADLGRGGFTLPTQSVSLDNRGTGVGNSGRNNAVGNDSFNTVTDPQHASVGAARILAGSTVANNTGAPRNNSDGSASISTGAVNASGSTTTTNISQEAGANIDGNGFTLPSQVVRVTNRGTGTASSGNNTARGNVSFNDTSNNQHAHVGAAGAIRSRNAVASNVASTSNQSDGHASITTGDASAWGNYSTTNIDQNAPISINGHGFVIGDQRVIETNTGRAVASSGNNKAIGNNSDNGFFGAHNNQHASVGAAGALRARSAVASNTATTANKSDGRASIDTGSATAYGNATNDEIDQDLNLDLAKKNDFAIVDQRGLVTNRGAAVATTGNNTARGNVSFNDAGNNQNAHAPVVGLARNAVANNTASTVNNSNGKSAITTGDALAIGNHSATGLGEAAGVDPGQSFTLVTQTPNVSNVGTALARTGGNSSKGNNSDNATHNHQRPSVGGGPNVVANNSATTRNNSNGSGTVHTGNATAIGNESATNTCTGVNTTARCPKPELPQLPPPPCPCHKQHPTPTPKPPVTQPKPPVVPTEVSSPVNALPRTGGPIQELAVLGALLVLLGEALRRRSRITA